MKIKKKTAVNSCIDVLPAEPTVAVAECKYGAALSLIQGAIEALAEIAKDDPIAKDSIANLGVVMLDLKGGC